MLVHRRENVPAMPESLRRLGETIHLFGTIRGFYRGQCAGQDGSIALIFINEDLLEPLGQCTTLFMDGTFKVRFKKILFISLFSNGTSESIYLANYRYVIFSRKIPSSSTRFRFTKRTRLLNSTRASSPSTSTAKSTLRLKRTTLRL